MIEAFEARLADVIADRLGPTPEIAVVTRPRDGLDDPPLRAARVIVQVLAAQSASEVGDDRTEVLGERGHFAERPVLRLHGDVLIEVAVATTAIVAEQPGQRRALLRALDRLLLALHATDVRDGSGFALDVDQGFALDGFRLDRSIRLDEATVDYRRISLIYRFAGRFWPVQPAVEGPSIRTVPTRVVVLPIPLPERLTARAGGEDLRVPLTMDLRATGGAAARLVARLRGASPPGQLIGDPADLPPGSVGYFPDATGRYEVRYHPPAAVAGAAQARIALELAHPDRATVELVELVVEVRP